MRTGADDRAALKDIERLIHAKPGTPAGDPVAEVVGLRLADQVLRRGPHVHLRDGIVVFVHDPSSDDRGGSHPHDDVSNLLSRANGDRRRLGSDMVLVLGEQTVGSRAHVDRPEAALVIGAHDDGVAQAAIDLRQQDPRVRDRLVVGDPDNEACNRGPA